MIIGKKNQRMENNCRIFESTFRIITYAHNILESNKSILVCKIRNIDNISMEIDSINRNIKAINK